MANGVADEVREHLSHPLLVDADLEIGRSGRGEEQHVALARRLAPVARQALEQRAGGNRGQLERHRSRLELGEVEQLLDEGAEPLDLLEHLAHRLRRDLLDAVDEVLEPGPECADRRPELVRGVRDEVAAHAVGLVQLRGHRVERARELSHLVPGGRGDPPGVVAACHRAGGRHHLPQRRGHPVRQHLDDRERERCRREAADQRREAEPLAEPDDADGDEHRGDDHDAELELDRVEGVERSHSSEFVSRA